ncbi:ATP-binding protein [Streptomyces sp. V3I7]|uniref:ATP-binding protein n=1 Tax=Streptomyces sp. V3I7 TaxID=3042278 RepID=UPI002782FB74|nr:ATP-binding protein [Streptomyces sp. V3I7]MDQ0992629.1 anti-sigma regulatory factor (Ser/Thr protein kinase) [Streptomyces sp. V3I7]
MLQKLQVSQIPNLDVRPQLPHDPRAARIARVTLRAVLAGHGMAQLQDTAELLASELVANAYRYSSGSSMLRLRGLGDSRLRVSVWDTNPHIPPPFGKGAPPLRPLSVEDVGGRGLFLVCHYADAWGGCLLGDDLFGAGGKVLWCEVGPSAVGGARAAS